jgi:hypothetical protein
VFVFVVFVVLCWFILWLVGVLLLYCLRFVVGLSIVLVVYSFIRGAIVIDLNGKRFARNNKQMVDSLFDGPTTCVGFYKVNKRSIVLMNIQRERIGVINRHRVLCCASKRDKGYWYSHGTIPQVGEYESYLKRCEEIGDIADRFGIN